MAKTKNINVDFNRQLFAGINFPIALQVTKVIFPLLTGLHNPQNQLTRLKIKHINQKLMKIFSCQNA
jgi:hypothetical protein